MKILSREINCSRAHTGIFLPKTTDNIPATSALTSLCVLRGPPLLLLQDFPLFFLSSSNLPPTHMLCCHFVFPDLELGFGCRDTQTVNLLSLKSDIKTSSFSFTLSLLWSLLLLLTPTLFYLVLVLVRSPHLPPSSKDSSAL